MANPVVIGTQPDWVDEVGVKKSLEALRGQIKDPKVGLFGPDSMYWEVNRHSLVYYPGAVPAVLMQLVHPWVAVAIGEHSKIMTNPRQRARMTYTFLWSIIYGDMDLVARRSLSLYKMHTQVTGTIGEEAGRHQRSDEYRANERNAMLWVHVTAFYGRVNLYEKLIRQLTPAEKDQMVQEAKLYAACFSIDPASHPDNWAAVERYIADMQQTDTLAATEAGLKVAQFLENTIPKPLRKSFAALNSLSVPERTRELLGLLPDNADTQKAASRMVSIFRTMNNVMPAKLRYVPAWHEAMARINGDETPGWVTAKMNKLILGTPRLVF